MMTIRSVLPAAVAVLLAGPSAMAGWIYVSTVDLLPPPGSGYAADLGFYHSYLGGVIRLNNPIHDAFTGGAAPPAVGGTSVHSFGSTISGDLTSPSFNGHISVSGVNCTVRVTGVTDNGIDRTFNTEMLQLDISGGGLPPGVMIRESPTRASLGQTSIHFEGGLYYIESFFDVFTDLSLDGGQTWIPSDGFVRMSIPGPGAGALLTVGVLFAVRRKR